MAESRNPTVLILVGMGIVGGFELLALTSGTLYISAYALTLGFFDTAAFDLLGDLVYALDRAPWSNILGYLVGLGIAVTSCIAVVYRLLSFT